MRSHPSCWNKTLTQLGFKRKPRKASKASKASKRKNSRARRSVFENLEQRQLLAVTVDPTELLVSTLADQEDGDYSVGNFSLREALQQASDRPGPDTIVFAPELAGGKILLENGQLAINSEITISGPGADQLTIDAGGASRVFRLSATATAEIDGVTITGGGNVTSGGGIYNQGNLTLQSVVVANNQTLYTNASGSNTGGGIYSVEGGTLRIFDSTIDGNRARWGGGVYAVLAGSNELEIDGSTFSSNWGLGGGSGSDGLGGGLVVRSTTGETGKATISNSTFSGNRSEVAAGIGIRNTTDAKLGGFARVRSCVRCSSVAD